MTPIEYDEDPARAPREPVLFAEPWQARAFAMTLALHESGLFTWPEWSAALGNERAKSNLTDDLDSYYQDWVTALEDLIVLKNAATVDTLASTATRWQAAAAATPHGTPVALDAAPIQTAEDP